MILDRYGRPLSATDNATALRKASRTPRFRNTRTGTGTNHDNELAAEFVATMSGREDAETLFRMSWAARKLTTIIVDDMFFRWRRWIGDDEKANEAMEQAEQELKLRTRLPSAMIAGSPAIMVSVGASSMTCSAHAVMKGQRLKISIVPNISEQIKQATAEVTATETDDGSATCADCYDAIHPFEDRWGYDGRVLCTDCYAHVIEADVRFL